MDRRRLFFDIETSPNVGFFWKSGWRERIPTENIIKERAIMCIAYKWENERSVHALTWDENKSDRKMLLEFVRVAEQATEIVAHNGDKFDIRWIRTRCMFHDIPMMPYYTSIDTLKMSRSMFYLNSNRLDYVAQYLGVGKKIHVDYDLWKSIMLDDDGKAMKKMVKYCKMDVVVLEKVFSRMWNYAKHKQHHGVLDGGLRGSCPECGSYELVIKTRRTTAMGYVRVQYRCNACGKYHQKPEAK